MVTSTIVWEGDESPGRWREYEGGYEDWKIQSDRAQSLREQAARAAATGKAKDSAPSAKAAVAPPAPKPRKLSYKEQRELDALPARIEALEAEQKELGAFLAQTESYTKEVDRAMKAQARVAAIDDELLKAMERWEALGSI